MHTVALYGGSFNPPGIHHHCVAQALAQRFDKVILVPCGPRPDKPTTEDIAPVYRAALADIAFGTSPKVQVELFDLEQATFTPNIDLETRYQKQGELWHVISADLTLGGAEGKSPIQQTWKNGRALWRQGRFVIYVLSHHTLNPQDLPPHHQILHIPTTGFSSTTRERLYRRLPYEHLVAPGIAPYIERYGLYRPHHPARTTFLRLPEPRLRVTAHPKNPRARAWAQQFAPLETTDNPNCILVLGGDGTMLRAIQSLWRLRKPFFGINAGGVGFLLNDPATLEDEAFPPSPMIVRQMPMLYLEIEHLDGTWEHFLSFKDAWIERSTGQSAWLEVRVNDRLRLPRLICDGALVSTAAGSTAYARSMGARPLLADSPAWLLAGSNVVAPRRWHSALLSLESTVDIRVLDPVKRPVRAFLHGHPLGRVRQLKARLSRIATAELAFHPQHDMAEKITRIQFPA